MHSLTSIGWLRGCLFVQGDGVMGATSHPCIHLHPPLCVLFSVFSVFSMFLVFSVNFCVFYVICVFFVFCVFCVFYALCSVFCVLCSVAFQQITKCQRDNLPTC
jgi:hypothetical protein